YTFPTDSCEIYQQPTDQNVAVGTNVMFFISSANNSYKRWQLDTGDGSGYNDLQFSYPYSGVNTDTLYISNVGLAMNNYSYRCWVYGTGGCYSNSSGAILFVHPVGIEEIEINNPFYLYPNPSSSSITLNYP